MSGNINITMEYQKVPSKENGGCEKSDIPESYGLGVRHIQVLLGFLSLSVGFIARAHMGVTVVAMSSSLSPHNISADITNVTRFVANTTTWEDKDYDNETLFNEEFEIENSTDGISKIVKRNVPDDGSSGGSSLNRKYNWSKSIQEMVLGSFFLGYTIMMLPMGIVSQKFGWKLPVQIALFVNAIASIAIPWMAAWGGWKAVCACRILQGLSQAGYYPGLQTFTARWSSFGERARFYGWVFTGTTFGTVIAFQMAGLLSASWGWPYTCYATGCLCLVMFVILTVFGAVTPMDHKTITEQERKFIMGKSTDDGKRKRKLPLKAAVTNKHILAIFFTHVGSSVAFVFMFTQAPTYIHYILEVDIKKSGLISSMPFVTSFFAGIIYACLSDFLTNRNILSLKTARIAFNSISQYGMALCFLAISFTKNVELATICLVLSMTTQTAQHSGWMVNYIDLSPTFSGTLLSMGNTIACSFILILPILVSFVVTDVTNQLQWRVIFISMAGLVTVANIIFSLYMSVEVQPFDKDDCEQTETEELQDMKSK
ncbi:putative inorganic phosphate cotransporter [Ostrinia furnacalis]|uniref:putative inorganic phosphate cotransporter n=1 Tax=Ostrinia furnacalis TaxID=93504 RepID=UPI00103B2731|nr:putative inorganic phosphate cotransporter [Ostrinia furnacalis]